MSDLLALVVVVPIAVAVLPLAPVAITRRLVGPLAALVGLGQLLVAVLLFGRVTAGGQLRYAVGAYPPPIGIELVGDAVSLLLVGLIGLATVVAVTQTRHRSGPSPYLYSQLLLASAGLAGLVVTGDVFNLYVFLEISGLAVYALVASRRSAPAAVAALRYLLVGTVGASLYLLGVGFLYISTGTLNMADMAVQLQSVGLAAPPVALGLVLVVVGATGGDDVHGGGGLDGRCVRDLPDPHHRVHARSRRCAPEPGAAAAGGGGGVDARGGAPRGAPA
jgi:multicomponent Na+:H+ antiporter subunit D